MEHDEAGTLEPLQANRPALVLPQIEKQGGRVVQLMGYDSLIEFGSVITASRSPTLSRPSQNWAFSGRAA